MKHTHSHTGLTCFHFLMTFSDFLQNWATLIITWLHVFNSKHHVYPEFHLLIPTTTGVYKQAEVLISTEKQLAHVFVLDLVSGQTALPWTLTLNLFTAIEMRVSLQTRSCRGSVFTSSLIPWFTHSLSLSLISTHSHSSIYLFIHSLPHSMTHSLRFTHSLTHPFTHKYSTELL